MARVTTTQVLDMARRGERIAVLTAYDFPSAKLVDAAGVPVILVGDSLGNVVLGYEGTVGTLRLDAVSKELSPTMLSLPAVAVTVAPKPLSGMETLVAVAGVTVSVLLLVRLAMPAAKPTLLQAT